MIEPLRIAQIIGKMNTGGVESFILNYYRNIDRKKIQFDFFIDSDSDFKTREIIESLGGRVFVIPPYQHIYHYLTTLFRIFKHEEYKIIHSHISTMNIFPLMVAKFARTQHRICHVHSTAGKGETMKNIFKYLLRPFSKLFPTTLCACSYHAGEWMYGKKSMSSGKVLLIKNAIDVHQFAYDVETRKYIRSSLKIENNFVIGHIGRFCYSKNQAFLIELLTALVEEDQNIVLLLVGDGEDKRKILDLVKVNNIVDQVKIVDSNDHVSDYYQAMDIFVFPSRYEGLGMVAIEAQFNGLPVICSTEVPKEAKITDEIKYCNLNDEITLWKKAILSFKDKERSGISSNFIVDEYDIRTQALLLEQLYLRLIKEKA